jgi:hypothetical protein
MSSQAFNNATANNFRYRNRLLNPDSYIDQRNSGALVTAAGYTVDRYVVGQIGTAGILSSQQDVSTFLGNNQPTFSSHKINVVTQHASLAAGDQYARFQPIEISKMRDSFWGTANAQPFVYTIGIYVPVAGVYSVSFRNYAATRSYVSTITIANANTLEFHSIVVPGDTGGTWATTPASAGFMYITLDLGAGSTYTTSTLNTWQTGNFTKATGSQSFCANTAATSMHVAWEQFEINYATAPEIVPLELALLQCQRYCQILGQNVGGGSNYFGHGFVQSTNSGHALIQLGTPMRVAPTPTAVGISGMGYTSQAASSVVTAISVFGIASTTSIAILFTGTGTPYTLGQAAYVYSSSTGTYIVLSSEL